MNKYSNFEFNNNKTRNEIVLEESLKNMKNYKNESNLKVDKLDGISINDNNFFELNNNEKLDTDVPIAFFNDPRYTQNNTRDESKKQINIQKNFKLQNNVNGFEFNNNFQKYEETNYEKSDTDLDKILKVKKSDTDLDKILKKIKGNVSEIDLKPVIKMPNKKLIITNVRGKLKYFKDIKENIQDMICHALINEWKDDFKLKKISTYIGVKNFILQNFKDKMNIFFVYLDDEGEFIGTFAIDNENFAPYISHIYINPNYRNKGFGKRIIKYAEKYIKKQGFNASNLWCDEKLIKYYKKNKYNIDSSLKIAKDREIWKMIKNL